MNGFPSFLRVASVCVCAMVASLVASAQTAPVDAREKPAASAASTAERPAPSTNEGGGKPADAAKATSATDEFARADTDCDGRISAEEYSASELTAVESVAAGKRRGTKSFNKAGFRRADTDNDGVLSRREWDAALKAMASLEKS